MHIEDGTVALVTGGASGIGRGIAEALANAGVAVAISGRRLDAAEEAAEEIRDSGGQAIAVQGDVANEDHAARVVEATVSAFGGLHVLVNNAGIARAAPLEKMSADDVDALIDVDLKGPIWMIRAALPHLAAPADEAPKNGGSSIVNISSSVTLAPVPNYAVYSAAKAGLDMLTRCLARDLAGKRIRVNAICPGVVETPIFETMMPKNAVERAMRQMAGMTPLGRVGQPEDVARLVLFLVGPANAWMTGAVIPLDGGLSLAS